jgi:hypothetical protein
MEHHSRKRVSKGLSDLLLVLVGIVGPQPVLCRRRLRRFSHKSIY